MQPDLAPPGWEHVGRVLVMRLDNVGDVVMTGPVFRTLRRALPGARLVLMTSPAGAQVAPLLPCVDDVLVHRALWQDARAAMPLDPARELALVERLRSGHFDAAVILTSFRQTPFPAAYACYLAGIPIRLGRSALFGGGVLSPCAPAVPDDLHQVARNLSLLEAAGFTAARRDLELRVPASAREGAARVLAEHGIDPERPCVVVAPGASCSARQYDVERFAAVAAGVADAAGMPVVVVGSPRETALAEHVASRARAAVPRGRPSVAIESVAGRTTVPELAALVEHAALVVCNDSGPMHMADALRRPMVVLFSGTDLESQWAPRSSPAVLLRRPTDCAPCYRFDCPYGLPCLDIAPGRVVREALALLGRPTPETAPATTRELRHAHASRAHLARPRQLPVLPGADAA